MAEHHDIAFFAEAGSGDDGVSRLLGAASAHFYLWDVESDALGFTPPWPAVFGAAPAGEPVLGRTLQARVAADDAPARLLALTALLERGEALDGHYKLRRADGEMEWVEEHAVAAPPGPDGGRRILGTIRVVTAAKSAEERLRRAASYDRLTGLYNRERLSGLMAERLARKIHERVTAGLPYAL